MGLLTDAGLDSGAYRNRLLSSTNGLQYWDESVGRRQFAWDTVNNRWQLVHGDTFWRNISALLVNAWTGTVYLRRVNYTCHLHVEALDNTPSTAATAMTLPSGFFESGFTGARLTLTTVAGTTTPLRMSISTVGAVVVPQTPVGSYYGTLSYALAAAWPVALPGTAVGTIPFA
jgi:hypothetical protein